MTSKDLPHEVQAFFDAHPEIDRFDLLLSDMHGGQRGKKANRDGLAKLFKGGMNFPLGVHFLDVRGEVIDDSRVPGADDGDPDALCHAVPGTLTTSPWTDRPTGQVLMTVSNQDGTPFFGEPRHILTSACQPLRDMGLTPVVAIELEFYLLQAQAGPPTAALADNGFPKFTGPQVYNLDLADDFADFFGEVEDACRMQGIPASTALSEYSDGQFEINLDHVDNAESACDHAFLLKRVIRSVARNHGYVATFMAKPRQDLCGSGLHIHLSLLDEKGRNIFEDSGSSNGKIVYADTLRHAVGGTLATMSEAMAIFLPNANSYRRLQPGFFAPLEPVWGPNHRSMSVRIPLSDSKNRRIEHRVAGADSNPYLALAALLGGVHYGLTNKIAPPKMQEEFESYEPNPTLPNRLTSALQTFKEAQILPQYFGPHYWDLYAICKELEDEKFHGQIADRDYEWFLRAF